MESLTIKISKTMNEQLNKYAALKKINKSQAARELIESGIDVTAQESELLKEIKSFRTEMRDNHAYNKKGFDRLASLCVKNGKKIFSIWHLVLIQVFLRSKDKGLDDQVAKGSRDEVEKTATNFGIREYNNKD